MSVKFQCPARSKAWVCGRSLAGIEFSNPTGGMDFCLFCLLYCQGFLRRADHSSRGDLPTVVCLNVIVKLVNEGAVAHWVMLSHWGNNIDLCFMVFVVMTLHFVVFWFVTPCRMRTQVIWNDTFSPPITVTALFKA